MLAAALACAAASAVALPATALSDATQAVSGVVQPQFGATVGTDGRVDASSSTIAVSITRTTQNGVAIVTIAPRD